MYICINIQICIYLYAYTYMHMYVSLSEKATVFIGNVSCRVYMLLV